MTTTTCPRAFCQSKTVHACTRRTEVVVAAVFSGHAYHARTARDAAAVQSVYAHSRPDGDDDNNNWKTRVRAHARTYTRARFHVWKVRLARWRLQSRHGELGDNNN